MANIFTCSGFDTGFFGGCSMAMLGLVILFFVVVFSRKWLGEEMGVPFNTTFAFVGAYLPYLIVVSLTASSKWALLAGLIGFVIGGIAIGMVYGSDTDL